MPLFASVVFFFFFVCVCVRARVSCFGVLLVCVCVCYLSISLSLSSVLIVLLYLVGSVLSFQTKMVSNFMCSVLRWADMCNLESDTGVSMRTL